MASLVKHESDDKTHFHVAFRYAGKRFLRSLRTTDEKEARKHLANIKDTLKDVLAGRVGVPADCDPDTLWAVIQSGGRRLEKHSVAVDRTLASVIEEYTDTCPVGAKENNTLASEKAQFKNIARLLGGGTPLNQIDVAVIEKFIRRRQKEDGHLGRPISPNTIKKELATFSQMWLFALNRGYVKTANPVKAARKPKPDADAPFQTWSEIERTINRSNMNENDQRILWSSLFMDEEEILALLAYIKSIDDVAYAAIAFVAFTGCRRSEMMRAQTGDVDFLNASIRIREKKKSRSLNTTYRTVRMHPKLAVILKAYLKAHDGGQVLFPSDNGEALTEKQVDVLFKRSVAGSRWEVIEGYHVLRHSFISNCAVRGIPQAVINGWVGHTTVQMQERYRHLFPVELEAAMERLYS